MEHFKRLTQLTIPRPIAAAGLRTFVVATYNINGVWAKCERSSSSAAYTSFTHFADSAHLLMLQEAHEDENQLAKNHPGFEVFCSPNGVLHTMGMGALLRRASSPWTARCLSMDFGGGPWPQGRALTLEVSGFGVKLAVLSVHRPYASSSADDKKKGEVQDWMYAYAAHLNYMVQSYPLMIVCGDLNHTEEVEKGKITRESIFGGVFKPLRHHRFVNVLAGTSEEFWPTHYPAKGEFDRLDYIFASPALSKRIVRNSGAVLSQGTPWGDHCPVVATFMF